MNWILGDDAEKMCQVSRVSHNLYDFAVLLT